eukprot:gene45063-35005_t
MMWVHAGGCGVEAGATAVTDVGTCTQLVTAVGLT